MNALQAAAKLLAAVMFAWLGAFAPSMVYASAKPHTLPAVVADAAPGLILRGEAVMRFVGLKVYDIRLWTSGGAHSFDEPFALELVYDLGLKGKDIASRSVDEMRKVGYRDEMKLAQWNQTMTRVFPDIKKTDTLVGVYRPKSGVQFFSRDRLIATVDDAEFAKAFFEIWLSPKTSEPKLRQRLLGSNDANATKK